MGTWSLPKTAAQADRLADLMAGPIPASQACDLLYPVIGDDNLFDNIISIVGVEPEADVRGAVVSTLQEIYFTGMEAVSFGALEAVERVGEIVRGYEAGEDEAYLRIALLADEGEALKAAAQTLEIPERELGDWTARRNSAGLDFVVVEGATGRAYSIAAASGVMIEILPENLPFHTADATAAFRA